MYPTSGIFPVKEVWQRTFESFSDAARIHIFRTQTKMSPSCRTSNTRLLANYQSLQHHWCGPTPTVLLVRTEGKTPSFVSCSTNPDCSNSNGSNSSGTLQEPPQCEVAISPRFSWMHRFARFDSQDFVDQQQSGSDIGTACERAVAAPRLRRTFARNHGSCTMWKRARLTRWLEKFRFDRSVHAKKARHADTHPGSGFAVHARFNDALRRIGAIPESCRSKRHIQEATNLLLGLGPRKASVLRDGILALEIICVLETHQRETGWNRKLRLSPSGVQRPPLVQWQHWAAHAATSVIVARLECCFPD